eukprot:1390184-Amorphochlora_amoeboformis.AAC.2
MKPGTKPVGFKIRDPEEQREIRYLMKIEQDLRRKEMEIQKLEAEMDAVRLKLKGDVYKLFLIGLPFSALCYYIVVSHTIE